eukprot:6181156-Pleurochrysis_carterae.AAC.1
MRTCGALALRSSSSWKPTLAMAAAAPSSRVIFLEPPRRRVQSRARVSSQPPNSRIYIFLLAPARPGW